MLSRVNVQKYLKELGYSNVSDELLEELISELELEKHNPDEQNPDHEDTCSQYSSPSTDNTGCMDN